MPVAGAYRRKFKPYKKTYTKKTYGKKKRFSKKTFYKASKLNTTVIRPTVYSRELYTKMRYVQMIGNQTIPLTSSLRFFWLGNSASPYPPQGALGAFVNPNNVIPAGEQYPGGLVEYASFYDKYTILGSSIKVFLLVANSASSIVLRMVLIPIAPTPDSGTDDIATMINQLDGYTYQQLMSYPQAQHRLLMASNSGFGKSNVKAFRKTKYMFNVKDMKDDNDRFNEDMPSTAGANGRRPSENNQWGYYVRVFNDSSSNVTAVDFNVTMKLYFRLNQRRFVQATTST